MVKSVLLSALLTLGVLGLLAPRACQSAVASDISFPIVLGEFLIDALMFTCT